MDKTGRENFFLGLYQNLFFPRGRYDKEYKTMTNTVEEKLHEMFSNFNVFAAPIVDDGYLFEHKKSKF